MVDGIVMLNRNVPAYPLDEKIEHQRVLDMMNKVVVTVRENCELSDAAHYMVEHRISGLPVVDEYQKLIGIITEADFLRALGVPSHHPTHSLWQTLETMFTHGMELKDIEGRVADLMVTDVVTVAPESTVHDVIGVMKKNRIKRVIVCDSERHVLGMVTRSDLVRIFFDRMYGPGPAQDMK